MCRRVLLTVLVVVLFRASPARAWIFPEHAELTRFGADELLPGKLRKLLAELIFEVTVAGLPLCTELAPPFEVASASDCVAYSALPALAGDHSVSAEELEINLRSGLGLRVVRTGSKMWRDFLNHAPGEVSELYRGLWFAGLDVDSSNPHDASSRFLSRRLDLKFAAVDPGYASRAGETRAHFQDATAGAEVVLIRAARVGDVNNAVAQMMVHHVRSMILMAHARKLGVPIEQARALVVDALLEHAFALHFLQDVFASGHIGTGVAVAPRISRKRRHDYLNRVGVSVIRAEVQAGCKTADSVLSLSDNRLPRCWIAYGDGYLNQLNALVTARAVAAIQAQFVLAANPGYLAKLLTSCPLFAGDADAGGDRPEELGRRGYAPRSIDYDPPCAALVDIAYLLLPTPPHTLPAGPTEALRELIVQAITGRRAEWAAIVSRVIAGLGEALENLAKYPIPKPATADASADQQNDVLSADVLGAPFSPCRRGEPAPGSFPFCTQSGTHLAFGGLDVSLWRPVLVWLATPRADVRTIHGDDSFGYGVALQVVYGAELGVLVDQDVPLEIGPWFGGGVSLRADRLFPSRDNRALVEANLGLMPTLFAGWGQERYRTQFFGELRVPIVTALVAALAGDELPIDIGPNGGRVYFTLPTTAPPDAPGFWGADAEILNIKLNAASDPRTYAPGLKIDDELRLRVGALRGPTQDFALHIGIEVASGHSVFINEFE